jgi:isoamylase
VWTRVVDTALETQAEDAFKAGHLYTVTGRSLLVFSSSAA